MSDRLASRSVRPLRIGIVGANAERGWARDAHLPALNRLPGLAISAVSARTQALAEAAAPLFGHARAFGDTLALVRDPEVDIVAVTVKVPEHRAVVLAALEAGKHVYCEWPLGRGVGEAEEMAHAASRAGVHAMIGLQGLSAPAIRQAVQLIADGAIGAPRLLRVVGSAAAWGPTTPRHGIYLQDRGSGATLETIGGGHTLAAIEALVGAYVEVDSRNSTLCSVVRVEDSDELVQRTCSDHMFVLGKHASGCVSMLEIVGGGARQASFEVEGEKGRLRVVGTVAGTYQIPELRLEADVPFIQPAPIVPGLAGAPANLAEAWTRFAADIEKGSFTVPDFTDALGLTRLLASIDIASEQGRRQYLS